MGYFAAIYERLIKYQITGCWIFRLYLQLKYFIIYEITSKRINVDDAIYVVASVQMFKRFCVREDLFITHLNIIIKSEVSTFPIVVIYFHVYVSEVVVPSHFACCPIKITEKLDFIFILIVLSMMCANIWVYYGPRLYSFVSRLHYVIIIIFWKH